MVSRSSFSRNSRSSSGADAIPFLRRRCLGGYTLNRRVENGFGGLAVRMGVEIEDDAMPQHRGSHVQNVFHRQVKPPFDQGADPAALYQTLGAARRAAIADILAGHLVCF